LFGEIPKSTPALRQDGTASEAQML
jgi:hypothetical protein